MEENAGAFYHLTHHDAFSWYVHANRNTLLYAMHTAGFSSYPYEIWHFNFGNQMDAITKNEVARYSYCEP
jgi:D-alanyl-D-alanine dipeptidase